MSSHWARATAPPFPLAAAVHSPRLKTGLYFLRSLDLDIYGKREIWSIEKISHFHDQKQNLNQISSLKTGMPVIFLNNYQILT